MPIRRNTFDAPQTDPQEPEAPVAAAEPAVLPAEDSKPKTRKRRTKAELIADAVVPADDEEVEIKFESTGSVSKRVWPKAVELVRDGAATFKDASLRYAVEKMGQPAPPEPAPSTEPHTTGTKPQEAGGPPDGPLPVQTDGAMTGAAVGQRVAPDEAEVGDTVIYKGVEYTLGHGHQLVQGQVDVDGKFAAHQTRWEHDENGQWFGHSLKKEQVAERAAEPDFYDPEPAPAESVAAEPDDGVFVKDVQDKLMSAPQRTESEVKSIGINTWKITMGFKEKIGLPDYSNLEIGPVSVQRFVVDDGSRQDVDLGGNVVSLPASVIAAAVETSNVAETIMRWQRQSMIDFLSATKPGSVTS